MRKILRIGLLLFSMAVVFCSSGCATGPIRYKILGHYKYATTEFSPRVSLPVKPLAITGGLVTDGFIMIADSVVIPIVSLPLAIKGAVFGSEPDLNIDVGEILLRLTTFPVYFPWGYALLCYFQSYAPSEKQYYKMFYPGFYGEESSFFLDSQVIEKKVSSKGGERATERRTR